MEELQRLLHSRNVRNANLRTLTQPCVLVLLTLQNTCLVLVTKLSYRDSAKPYVISSVVVCAESLKFLTSCLLVVILEGYCTLNAAFLELPARSLKLCLPAWLYVLQNNLLFRSIKLLSPTVFVACSQSKILTSAFFSGILCKTQITRKQIFALCELVLGMFLVQNDGTIFAGKSVVSKTSLKGVLYVLMASTTSGFAGAYLEKLFKENVDGRLSSIWLRNVQLSFCSLPIAVLSMYWEEGCKIFSYDAFTGYDSVVITVIVLQAIGGLIIAAVMRHAGNMMKCFAVSLSICNCVIATTFTEGADGSMTRLQMMGLVLVVSATYSYTSKKK